MTTHAPRPRQHHYIARRQLPDTQVVDAAARRLATAYLEVRDGVRPFLTLAPFVSPHVLDGLAALVRRHRRHPLGSRPVQSLRVVTTGSTDAYESCVIARHDGHVTAVAMRFEHRRGRWMVVSLASPEDLSAMSATPTVTTGRGTS